ncbi:DUF4397 domain-containing protein [Pedobacter sp. Du54]|uniref:DUF4397 domain-containing protein n=1 Tax=Pedobacter anseongensis TaxID=3133439 RepID=UPI0030AA1C33
MKKNFKHAIKASALLLALSFTFVSCKDDKDDEPTAAMASLTVVNSVEGSGAQDFYVNDSKKISSLTYGSNANISITSGTNVGVFRNSSATTVNASATFTVGANTKQTMFLIKNADGSYGVNAYSDDNTSTSGKARVRFINLSPTLGAAINVTTSTGTSLASALAYRGASTYQTIDANTALNVNVIGSLQTTTIAGSEFQAGKVYTIWFDSSTTTEAKYHVIAQN